MLIELKFSVSVFITILFFEHVRATIGKECACGSSWAESIGLNSWVENSSTRLHRYAARVHVHVRFVSPCGPKVSVISL